MKRSTPRKAYKVGYLLVKQFFGSFLKGRLVWLVWCVFPVLYVSTCEFLHSVIFRFGESVLSVTSETWCLSYLTDESKRCT